MGREVKVREKIIRLLPQMAFSLSFILLLFLYRMGSARVDRGTEPGMRDLGTYLRAGSNFLLGIDPYSDPAMRIGPSLLPFFGLLNNYFPPLLLAFLFQSLAMLGICFFVAQFAKISFKDQPAVFLVVLWISSVRENLVNIQITGFLALLFTFGCSLVKMKRSSLQVFLGCILVAVSMDSKPHLFGLATVVFFFLIGRFRLFFLVMTQVVLIHAILSAYIGKLLTKSWLNTLFGIYEIRKEGKLGESLNLWPIIESFGVSSRVTSQLSMILFGFIAILFFYGVRFRRINGSQSILLAFIVPSFGIFYHYYDLSLVMSLFFVSAIISQHLSTAIISLPIFLVPSGFLEIKNLAIVLGILVMLRISGNLYRKVNIKDFLTMIFIYIVYSTILLTLPLDIKHQIQVTFTVVFVTLTILLLNFQDSKSIIPRKVD